MNTPPDLSPSDRRMLRDLFGKDPVAREAAQVEWKRRVADPLWKLLDSVTQEEVDRDVADIWSRVQRDFPGVEIVVTDDPRVLVNGRPPCA